MSADIVSKTRELNNRNKKAPAFEFTKLRNNYIHDGFDAFGGRYYEALGMIDLMRALAERYLLNYAGIDYTKTSMGAL